MSSVEWRGINPVTISLGVAAVPECVANARDVLSAADQACTRQEGRRNRVTAAMRHDSGA